MEQQSGSDPVEIDVLAALMSGTATVDDVVVRTKQPMAVVQPILDRAVAEQTVNRIAFSRTAEYSLTPKGLYLVGTHQGGQAADTGHAEVGATTGTPVERDAAAPDPTADRRVGEQPPPKAVEPVPVAAVPVAAEPAQPSPQPEPQREAASRRRKVTKRHVAYAVGYILIGLFLMLLQPVIGLLAVIAGVVLGAIALRPLWSPGNPSTTDAGPDA